MFTLAFAETIPNAAQKVNRDQRNSDDKEVVEKAGHRS